MTEQQLDDPAEQDDQNDEIISTAFRWSLVFLAIAGAIGAAVYFWPRPDVEEKVVEKKKGEISSLADRKTETPLPEMNWKNIAPGCGIDFVHFSGATGERLLPETMGGGVAIFDYDNDGDNDVLFVSGTQWPNDTKRPLPISSVRLYRNLGEAKFEEATREAGLICQVQGMGCAVGDYDNDGWLDLYITCVGKNLLFRNETGKFSDVTQVATVAGDESEWSTAAGFFDYNRDGHMDLMVCNYVKWSRELDFEVNFSLNGKDRAYGPPTDYSGCQPRLFAGKGDGTFEDRTEAAGLMQINPQQNVPLAKGLGLLLVDLNSDQWDDIVVANDTVRNQAFINQKDGSFIEVGATSGLAYDRMGNSTGAMGIDIAHPWNDGSQAIAIGNFANEMSSVYVCNNKDLSFVDQAAALGIGAPTRQRLSFGTLWEDFDLDGRVDLLQVNGHLEDTITEVQPSQTFRQSAQLFWNNGAMRGVCFSLLPDESVGALATPIVGRGGASGDLDGDGDIDLVITQIDGPPLVLINELSLEKNYLRIKLEQQGPNRFCYGAVIQVGANEKELATRYVTPTRSYLSQTEIVATFGFPEDQKTVSLVRIFWPDGTMEERRDVELNQTMMIKREERMRR